jgi:hypothetical protein
LAASGCTTPFGPSYTIEKQRIEVTFSPDAPDRVAVRAWYQMKNTGSQPLEEMSVKLPSEKEFPPRNVRVEWRGKPLASPSNPSDKGVVHVPLGTRWSRGDRSEFTVSYELEAALVKPASPAQSGPAVFLPSSGWYPTLVAPQGSFSSGGNSPAKWDLVVTAPQDYHVHASGRALGLDHSSGKNKASVSLRFEQAELNDFGIFVAAGPYVEQQITTSIGKVIFWSARPVPNSRASEISERIASDAKYFASEFGRKETIDEPVWIIECPPPPPSNPPAQFQQGCRTEPLSAIVPDRFLAPDAPESMYVPVDFQLAETWFGFSLSDSPEDSPWPILAARDYAAEALLASRDAASRGATIKRLLNILDSYGPEKSNPLIAIRREDSSMEQAQARTRSQLFFFALEDRCGSANLHHALARLIRILHGQTWGINDLRSAAEAECGTDLADFFRQWLNRPGIPGDFRARYAGSTVAAPKQPGQK